MQIAIIGAGISGAAAARALVEAGHDVTLFDKGRRVGGRASTREADGGRYRFDHGAQYFTARSTAFRSETERWIRAGVAAKWDARIGVAGGGTVRAKDDDTERFVGVPGMNAIVEALAAPVRNVRCGVRVESVVREGARWALLADDTPLATADAVLVTAPAPQAAALVASAPALREVCDAARMAPCWAVMAAFDAALPIATDGLFIEDPALRWAARDASKPGRDGVETWVIHASDAWSAEHLERDPEEVRDALLAAFFDATGARPVTPRYARAHRWRYATPLAEDGPGCVVDGTLAIAGDWLAGARVEGAYLSGLEAARRIVEARA